MSKAVFLSVAFALTVALSLAAQEIRGDYIESRSTDVYVAQCFANGEVGLTSNFALMAWHEREVAGQSNLAIGETLRNINVGGTRLDVIAANLLGRERQRNG